MNFFKKLLEHGPLEILRKGGRLLKAFFERIGINLSKFQLKYILWRHKGKPIIYFAPYTNWNTPLFQRPHYIAQELSQQGFLYFFGTKEDWRVVQGFKKMSNSLYLTNRDDLVSLIKNQNKLLHLYSTDNVNGIDYVRDKESQGWISLYEFIDEFDERVFLTTIKDSVRKKHAYLLNSDNSILIASAKSLINQIPPKNRARACYVPNGVDPSIFYPMPNSFKANLPLETYRRTFSKIVGYYGALASWVDWNLIKVAAKNLPHILFVFIGPDLDKSRYDAGLVQNSNYPNILFLPPVKHTELRLYAWSFDIAWIPFLINDITLSTSPLKVFEYLSMKLPVVATRLPEIEILYTEGHPIYLIDTHDEESLTRAFIDQKFKNQNSTGVRTYHWKSLSNKIQTAIHQSQAQTGDSHVH